MSETRNMNNGEYARVIAHLNLIVARESAYLARGMWNPHFVAANATTNALASIRDLLAEVDEGFYRSPPDGGYDGK